MHPELFHHRINLVYYLVLLAALSEVVITSDEDPTRPFPQPVSNHAVDQVQQMPLIKKAPKDYSYSAEGSRVRDLAAFFESMKKNDFEVTNDDQSQNVIISLSEAASKLHFLSFGYPLNRRCSKYVELITRPNIRTFATINLLMKENANFNEMEQTDANMMSRLLNERSFDALSKLQLLLQTLESEKSNSKSDFEPVVQKDLLDCINYYIYRHQRAISGVTDFVRETRNQILPLVASPVKTEVAMRNVLDLIDSVKHIESEEKADRKQRTSEWLGKLSKLYRLLVSEEFEVPLVVQEFITEAERLKRLQQLDPKLKISFRPKNESFNIEFSNQELPQAGEDREEDEAVLEVEKAVEEKNEPETTTSKPEALLFEQRGPVEEQAGQEEESLIAKQQYEPNIHDELLPEIFNQSLETSTNSLANSSSVQQKLTQKAAGSDMKSAANIDLDRLRFGSEEHCGNSVLAFGEYLRIINWRYLFVDQAEQLAKSLNMYRHQCSQWTTSVGNSEDNFKPSQWPVLSMTKKLTTWSVNQLRDLNQQEQVILNIMQLLN